METLGDSMPMELLKKVGFVGSDGKSVSFNENLVYAQLLVDTGGEFLGAFHKKFVDDSEMDKRSALVAVPEKLAIKSDNPFSFRIPRKILLGHGWVSEEGVLSHYNPNKSLMEKYAQFFIVNDKWRFNKRFEIFGPYIEEKGVIELRPGVYYLDLPRSERGKSALEFGVSVGEINFGKNAFRHPSMKKERETRYQWDAGWKEPTDELMLKEIAGREYAQGMRLFFRKHPDGPKPLYLMRPCKAGVVEFIGLHTEVDFDEEQETITVPEGHVGYWVGKKGEFIKWLSEFYDSKLNVKEYNGNGDLHKIKSISEG